jgi:cephalosporin hydroxylase
MHLTHLTRRISDKTLNTAALMFNSIASRRLVPRRRVSPTGPIYEITAYSQQPSDISDHLVTVFVEAAAIRPSVIVELGVRSGQSTIALSRVADLFASQLISVDLEDCSSNCKSSRQIFVKDDDIHFATEFRQWCLAKNITPAIDVLFIDTSHEFEHTRSEIEKWFPFLSDHCKVIFHDTNMSTVYFRKDRTMGVGWNNKRGVIGAIERYLDSSFDERRDFVDFVKGWIVKHHANCNGLTILERV